uniref:Uncharacterized protein n=1 Tax=Acanthochromis polyacanthus TaxID=80966 RepID=A0A3Q1G6Z9_9TELE
SLSGLCIHCGREGRWGRTGGKGRGIFSHNFEGKNCFFKQRGSQEETEKTPQTPSFCGKVGHISSECSLMKDQNLQAATSKCLKSGSTTTNTTWLRLCRRF